MNKEELTTLILGPSGSGKSTLIYSLINTMINDSLIHIDGLFINETFKIPILQQLKNLEEMMKGNKTYTGTSKLSIYNFSLKYNNKLVSRYEFTDYRGGIFGKNEILLLHDEKKELVKVRNILDNANIIFILLDCNEFKNEKDDFEKNIRRQLEEVKDSIERNPRYVWIFFIATKIDLLYSKNTLFNNTIEKNGVQYFIENKLLTPFKTNIDKLHQSLMIKATCIPISTLGAQRSYYMDASTKSKLHSFNIDYLVYRSFSIDLTYSIFALEKKNERN